MHSFRIQLQKHLPKFDEVTGDGITVIRFEATRIDFFSDAFVAFAVVVAYAVSIPAAPSPPPPPRATAGHFPTFSVPGCGHLLILRCPGAVHLPTPGLFPSF